MKINIPRYFKLVLFEQDYFKETRSYMTLAMRVRVKRAPQIFVIVPSIAKLIYFRE
jgi:hypothetical protein